MILDLLQLLGGEKYFWKKELENLKENRFPLKRT